MSYTVALCGLSAKDSHLVEIVITRVPNASKQFRILKPGAQERASLAIVDLDNPLGMAQFNDLRKLNPALVAIFVSDHGMAGESRYRIERRALLLRIHRTLEEAVAVEFSGSKVRSLPGVTSAATAAPSAKTPTSGTSAEAAFTSATPQDVALIQDEVQPLRALVVDDSATVREQLKMALDRAGLTADLAEDAERASALLQQRSYDIAFLDVVMPGTDGYELCRRIKQNTYTRGLPVLLLTSRSSPFDRARGALAGCDSYLVKPVTWEAFYQALDRALTRSFRNDRTALAQRGYKLAQAR